MFKDVINLAYEHGGNEYRKILIELWGNEGSSIYQEYEEGKLRAFLFYVPLPLDYDMICVTDRYNDYTLSTWRVLSKLLRSRTKEIRINSRTRHPTIQKAIKKYNGYREGDELIFTRK